MRHLVLHFPLLHARALALVFSFGLVMLTPALGLADREAAPGQIMLLSDEIFGNSVNVTRPSSGGGNGNNRSGLGDGTNPGQGSGTANSPNQGTDNPSASGGDSKKGGKKGGKSTTAGKPKARAKKAKAPGKAASGGPAEG